MADKVGTVVAMNSSDYGQYMLSMLQDMVKIVPEYLQDSKEVLANFQNFTWKDIPACPTK